MKRGKFIVIEGGDGSGKGTMVEFLKDKLSKRNDIIFTREPGGTEFGEAVRKIFLSQEMKGKISVLAELLTFCMLRANICDLLIRPAIKSGKNVISDRFDASTIAYQIYGRKHRKFEDVFRKINSIAKGQGITKKMEPDLVIYLDVKPETGILRAKKRKGKNTRFDEEEINFHKKVRQGYLAQLKIQKNWVKVDANQNVEKVKEEVWKLVQKYL
jgi:dTMP kinase